MIASQSRFLVLLLICAFFTRSVAVVAAPGKAKEILIAAGFTDHDIAEVLEGKLIKRVLDSSNEREIGMAFAVLVEETPEQLNDIFISLRLKKIVDPAVTAYTAISEQGTIQDFDKLKLEPGGDATAEELLNASPGDDFNLSRDEIALFNKLQDHKGKAKDRVENRLREMLFNRYESYKQKGLAGVWPYAREDKDYLPAEDLALSEKMSEILKQHTPVFYKHLVNFPANRPDNLTESYSWVSFDTDGKPNIELLHRMGLKENGAFVFSERQYYALNGYNCVHGEGGAIPSDDDGRTLLIFSSRTSTDAVTGIGGYVKRAVGVRMMGTMVSEILEKYQEATQDKGDEL
jgi:hypothetical protein